MSASDSSAATLWRRQNAAYPGESRCSSGKYLSFQQAAQFIGSSVVCSCAASWIHTRQLLHGNTHNVETSRRSRHNSLSPFPPPVLGLASDHPAHTVSGSCHMVTARINRHIILVSSEDCFAGRVPRSPHIQSAAPHAGYSLRPVIRGHR